MITVAKVSSTAYYTDGNGGAGMESYYLDAVTEGEPPGRWMGRGAALLGLAGEVTADHMETLFEECVNPVTGEQLGRRPPGGPSLRAKVKEALAGEPDADAERQTQIRAEVAASHRGANLGWDLTFAVPKSVSLAHAAAARGQIVASRAGDEELAAAYAFVKEQIEAAVLDAAGAGLAAAEQVVTARATGAAGGATTWHHGDGLAAAAFLQHTNRSIEPHLHVHMVVSNKIRCEDGKWRAIDGQDLLAQQYGFSATAARALVEGVNARLGLAWMDRHDGVGKELAAVPAEFREVFSTRAIQTTAETQARFAAEEARLGRALTTQERFYIHRESGRDTRDRKVHDDLTADERNAAWNDRLAARTGRSMNSLAVTVLRQAVDALPDHLRAAVYAELGLPAPARTGETSATVSDGMSPAAATSRDEPGSGRYVAGVSEEWSVDEVLSKAVAGCAERSATWGRADLKQEIERNLPVLGIGVDDVDRLLERLTDQALASSDVVQVTRTGSGPARGTTSTAGACAVESGAAGPIESGSQSGTSPESGSGTESESASGSGPGAGLVFAAPSGTVYASRDTLIAESALRAAAIERGRHALDREQVAGWLDAHAPTIGADQRAAVEGIAASDAALTVLIGPAGTGKSYAAGALAAAWSDLTGGEGRVIGLALSTVAAQVLENDGIGLARNIDLWLAGQARVRAGTGNEDDHAFEVRARDVVLVDESSMVSTRHLETIRAIVDAAGARLVLTGDPAQLGPVEAGGVMGLLDGHAETYSLSQVRRFSHAWERAASLALRAGQSSALEEYERHGRLVGVPTMDEAILEAARRAVADRVAGRSTVVVAASNDQADTVSARIRDHLIDLGIVSAGGGVLLAGRDGNTASTGDVITCRRNDYRLGVTNRVQYRVLAVGTDADTYVSTQGAESDQAGPDQARTGQGAASDRSDSDRVRVPVGGLLVERIGDADGQGGPILLPPGYVAADVQLGYASTVYGAQGLTTDTAYNLTGGNHRLDCAAQYVAQTRGRDLNVAIVALGRKADQSAPGPRTQGGGQLRAEDTTTVETPREVLAGALAEAATQEHSRWHRPGHDTAATVAAERDHATATAMDTLTGRMEAITRAACAERLDRHLDDAVAAGILDETNRARLGADQAREHLARLLRVVEQDDRDPRQVLYDALRHGKPLDTATSPAQVLSHRITRDAQRGSAGHALTAPAAGTAIPAGINPHAARELAALTEQATARTRQLGQQAAEHAPEWAVRALGPVPVLDGTEQAAADRADWEHRAGLVAAHRETVADTHPTRALDRMPGLVATERRAGYAAAWHALGRPDDALAEATMSEGRLRVRIQAWEREKAWEPPHVNQHLHRAETDLQEARAAAALADARAEQAARTGDLEQAATWRDQAHQHRQTEALKAIVVEGLTEQAETYTAWQLAAMVTQDNAERARAEAERRGLDLDTPADDTTTATAYLTGQQPHPTAAAEDSTAIAAEDVWRPVTETDLAAEDVTDDDRAWNTAQDPPTTIEIEAMTAGAAAVLTILADRASQEQAHHEAHGEDVQIETYEAGRRRRELADLDAALTAGHGSTADYATADSAAADDQGADW